MPFHRRLLLCSFDKMEILQPDHFIDTEGTIITKSRRVKKYKSLQEIFALTISIFSQMFVSHASYLINAEMLTAVDLCQ
jgi:hypothetical protein